MASSRFERIGTIFSRVTGLLQSRAMAFEDRPIWYDVYKTFPPALQPRYDRPAPKEDVRDIFYPEDLIRAKFHKHVGRKLRSVDLSRHYESQTQRVIECCNRLQSEKQLSFDDSFNNAVEIVENEVSVSSTLLRSKGAKQETEDMSLASRFKQASEKSQIDIKSIFKDDQ